MYRDKRVCALVPAYNEAEFIGGVVSSMPDYVDHIVVVDDGSTDGTGAVPELSSDSRVVLVTHDVNQGLGAGLVTAHKQAISLGADISVVMAGDGQMDPAALHKLLDPIVDAQADFTKGNRFFSAKSMSGMPRHRVFGNVVLSFMTKLATGYWNLFDPQNGYTAMSKDFQVMIPWDEVAKDYTFENDVLARLGLLRARIRDIDVPAHYGNEVSDIQLKSVVPSLVVFLSRAAWRRFWLQYVIRSFSPVALFFVTGVLMLLWSVIYGGWVMWVTVGPPVATTGTVMLAVLPFLMGFMLVLAAFVIDINNSPR